MQWAWLQLQLFSFENWCSFIRTNYGALKTYDTCQLYIAHVKFSFSANVSWWKWEVTYVLQIVVNINMKCLVVVDALKNSGWNNIMNFCFHSLVIPDKITGLRLAGYCCFHSLLIPDEITGARVTGKIAVFTLYFFTGNNLITGASPDVRHGWLRQRP